MRIYSWLFSSDQTQFIITDHSVSSSDHKHQVLRPFCLFLKFYFGAVNPVRLLLEHHFHFSFHGDDSSAGSAAHFTNAHAARPVFSKERPKYCTRIPHIHTHLLSKDSPMSEHTGMLGIISLQHSCPVHRKNTQVFQVQVGVWTHIAVNATNSS